MISNFVHLHLHTEYSLLDGFARLEKAIDKAKALGMPAVAITDHGSTSGLLKAQLYGEKVGVKVLLGTEFYYEQDIEGKELGHLVVIAKSYEGLQNIWEMQEKAYVDNFKRKPRINFEMLQEHSEGLVVTSACLANEICQHIMNGDISQAEKSALKFYGLLGDDFYLEIQPNSIPEQHFVNEQLIRISNKHNINLVATNDVHYIEKDDDVTHEVLLALSTNKKWDDPKRWRFDARDFWFKTEMEMLDGFSAYERDDIVRAIQSTVDIANKCDCRIPQGHYLPNHHSIPHDLPDVDVRTEQRRLLGDLVNQGYLDKYEHIIKGCEVSGKEESEYIKDVREELDVIDRNGYSGYFLVVADYIRMARDAGVLVGKNRGSGGGSKVAYLSDISRVEPEQFGLLFERFLADGREPDIDTDFSDIDAVFELIANKYGRNNVARIATYGKFTAKLATRRIMGCFGYSMKDISKVISMMPKRLSFTLQEALDENPSLVRAFNSMPDILNHVRKIEGMITQQGQHAGGVLIYPGINKLLPIITRSDDRTKRIVGFDKKELEYLGHFKFDILGLNTLPFIKRCLEYIKLVHDIDVDIENVDLEDPKVYDNICSGNLLGMFQIEAQSAKVMEQAPRNFRDLIAINALIRPGVGDWSEYINRRFGNTNFDIHEDQIKYMQETFGTMTYQEQFLLDCKVYAGWTIAFADKNVRKNKDIRNDTALAEKFVADGMTKGYGEQFLRDLWSEIVDAVDGGYSFNKSHAAGYADISYQTAYLKTYYPECFYSALLTENADNDSKVGEIIAECKRNGIAVLPPDIRNSVGGFRPSIDGIRFGFASIKGFGTSTLKGIKGLQSEIRNDECDVLLPDADLSAFNKLIERYKEFGIKKNNVESLIKCGCFDGCGETRNELLFRFRQTLRKKTDIKNGIDVPRSTGSNSEYEKECFGFFLSKHPCERYPIKRLSDMDEHNCLTGGIVKDVYAFFDKNQNEMAFIQIENQHETFKAIAFSRKWTDWARKAFKVDNVVQVQGRKSGNDVIIDDFDILEENNNEL